MKTHAILAFLIACQAGCVAVDDLTPDALERTATGRYPLAAQVEGFGAEPTSVSAAIGRLEFPLTHVGGGRWEGSASLGACAQGFELRYLVSYPTTGSSVTTAVEPPGATATTGGFLKWVRPEPKSPVCRGGASVFRVNSFGTSIDVNPGDGICDGNPGEPVDCTLAAAINEGNFAPGPITIELPAGSHLPNAEMYPRQDMVLQGLEPGVVISDHLSSSGAVTIEVRDLTLTRGIASHGGSLRLTNVSVLNNTASSFVSAGVTSRGLLVIERSTIRGNGRVGVQLLGGARAHIVDSLIAENGGTGIQHSGGIWCVGGSTTTTELSLTNSTISGNNGSLGGAWLGEGCNATLKNVTIAGNTVNAATVVNSAAGLTATARASVRLANSIVADNVNSFNPALANCAASAFTGTVTLESLGHNLFGSTGSCVLDPLVERPNLIGVSALLAPLADNGGPTQTRLPLPGSPALRAGSPDPFNDASHAACPHADQRGLPRIGPCDIGAVDSSR